MALIIMVGRAVGSSSRHALHLEAVACSWDELWSLKPGPGLGGRPPKQATEMET